MNTQEKNNTATNTGAIESPIAYADNGTSATITIQGAAYANLKKLAAAMNSTDWCEHDNTPKSLLENFIVGYGLLDNLAIHTEKNDYGLISGGVGEIAEDIINAIDTGFDDEGSPEAKKRIEELRIAFQRAGIYQ